MGKQADELIALLHASLAEIMKVLAVLSDAELDDASGHPCAMGGPVQDLLAHNIDHERMHVGQINTARYNMRKMQFSRTDRLMADTLRARSDLIASLIGLPDDALDTQTPQDAWTIRQMIEHTIYWERNSMDDLARNKLSGRVSADYEVGVAKISVQDPG